MLTQSLAIIDYLDETRGLGFAAPRSRGARAGRAIAQAIAMDIAPVCNLRVARAALRRLRAGMQPQDWMRPSWRPDWRRSSRCWTGPAPVAMAISGLADLCLVPQVYNARRWGVDLSGLPRITAIDAHLATLPAFQARILTGWARLSAARRLRPAIGPFDPALRR